MDPPNVLAHKHDGSIPTAELYNKDRAKFDKTAQEYTKKVSCSKLKAPMNKPIESELPTP